MRIIGITVSTRYSDLLAVIIPLNLPKLEKWYIVTHKDDKATIELCQKYPKIEILYYDFYSNPRWKFNKGGALRYAQQVVYAHHPTGWYLVFDSDIILPAGISLNSRRKSWQTIRNVRKGQIMMRLTKEPTGRHIYKPVAVLKPRKILDDVVIGCKRDIYHKMSQLKAGRRVPHPGDYPLNYYGGGTSWQGCPGYFQLYNHHHYYKDGMGGEDLDFCNEFSTKAEFMDLTVKHLGHVQRNWSGRDKEGDFLFDV